MQRQGWRKGPLCSRGCSLLEGLAGLWGLGAVKEEMAVPFWRGDGEVDQQEG